MEGLDVDDVFQHCRLNPTEVDAVTYYLPRLLSGETLHGVEKFIHSVEISGCEPKDLAARYAPVPQAVSNGDRFFFTTCKSKNGSKLEASAGRGTGPSKTTEISHGRQGRRGQEPRSKRRASPPGHGGVPVPPRPPSPRGEGVRRCTWLKMLLPPPRIGHRHASRIAARPRSRACGREEARTPPPILIRAQEKDALPHHPSPPHRFLAG
ncbi:hypothetical protein ZWY2020_049300 [Hordeum vulgare]|nr:hypothetical protein ZWY2020_049300 [Hordeum vulgare]